MDTKDNPRLRALLGRYAGGLKEKRSQIAVELAVSRPVRHIPEYKRTY